MQILKIKHLKKNLKLLDKFKNHQKIISKAEIHFYPFVNLNNKWKSLLKKEKLLNNYCHNIDSSI